jgi:MFS family permease
MIVGVVGPPLGGFIVKLYSFKTMLFIAFILYTTAAVLRFWMARNARLTTEAHPEALTLHSLKTKLGTMFSMILGGGLLAWIFLTDGVRDIAFRLSGELTPLYLDIVGGISIEQIGILDSFFGISMMMLPVISGRLSDKYGERVPIAGGFFFVSMGFVIFLQATGFWGFAASWAIFGVGVGMLNPAYQSLISKVVPKNMLGTFTGLFRSSLGFISLPAPWIGAQLWERFNPRLPFVITTIASFLSIIPIWFKFVLPNKEKREPTAGEHSA